MTKKTIYVIAAVVAVILITAGLSYGINSRDPLTSTLKKIYPAAIVGSRIISVDDSDRVYEIGRRMDSKMTRETALSQLIRAVQMKSLAGKLDVKLASDAVSDENNYLIKGKSEEYSRVLDSYFDGNERDFQNFVVEPSAYEAALRIKYNSDFSLNRSSHDRAQSVLDRINKGESFDELARSESEDEYTAQIMGDLGFFEHGQILPELERVTTVSALGEVKNDLVISRAGYHIIYPIETSIQDNKKLWHLKHIYFATQGFDQWFAKQSERIRIIKLK